MAHHVEVDVVNANRLPSCCSYNHCLLPLVRVFFWHQDRMQHLNQHRLHNEWVKEEVDRMVLWKQEEGQVFY